jgi:hypothetical protein
LALEERGSARAPAVKEIADRLVKVGLHHDVERDRKAMLGVIRHLWR